MRSFGGCSAFASGVRALNCGGNVTNGITAGLFASNLNNAPSNANWNIGASHSYGIINSN